MKAHTVVSFLFAAALSAPALADAPYVAASTRRTQTFRVRRASRRSSLTKTT